VSGAAQPLFPWRPERELREPTITICSFATLVAVTQIGCSATQRVYPDDDAGGSSATGGTPSTAAGKTLAVGGSLPSSAYAASVTEMVGQRRCCVKLRVSTAPLCSRPARIGNCRQSPANTFKALLTICCARVSQLPLVRTGCEAAITGRRRSAALLTHFARGANASSKTVIVYTNAGCFA
jgi:hypothetical protein